MSSPSKEFDFLTVHKRDPKTGAVIAVSPYKYVCSRDEGNYFLRNGKKYTVTGEEIKDPVKTEAPKK